jgi:hypothetical protein
LAITSRKWSRFIGETGNPRVPPVIPDPCYPAHLLTLQPPVNGTGAGTAVANAAYGEDAMFSCIPPAGTFAADTVLVQVPFDGPDRHTRGGAIVASPVGVDITRFFAPGIYEVEAFACPHVAIVSKRVELAFGKALNTQTIQFPGAAGAFSFVWTFGNSTVPVSMMKKKARLYMPEKWLAFFRVLDAFALTENFTIGVTITPYALLDDHGNG